MSLAAGDDLRVQLWRDGRKKTVLVKTKLFPLELADELAFRLLGIQVEDISSGNRRRFRIESRKGVVISKVERNSYLDRIGAEPGDVIRQIDDVAIQNEEDFRKTIVKFRRKNSVVLLLQRGGQGYYITVNLS
jgi:S1-C subfamily serine protease